MMPFQLDTSFAFPLKKIETLVTYTKVTKPTGISYILLVLINEIQDRKTKIGELLIRCGVPKDLHGIFADEIQKLMDAKIIQSAFTFNRDYLSEYEIGHFSFTEKGRKIFRDEAIPLDRNEDVKQEILFHPAMKNLMIAIDMQHGNSSTTVFDDAFYQQFPVPDQDAIEAFLNSKKSNGIPIKKEEIILETANIAIENRYITYPVTITLFENDSVDFNFKDEKLNAFFMTYYSAKIVQEGLLKKGKSKFDGPIRLHSTISSQIPVHKVYFPEELKQILNRKSQIDAYVEEYVTSNCTIGYLDERVFQEVLPNYALLKLTNANEGYAYAPASIRVNHSHFGDIEMNLLIERKLSIYEIQKVLDLLIAQHDQFDPDAKSPINFKKLITLCKVTNRMSLVIQKVESWLGQSAEENIVLLGLIRDQATNEPFVYEYIKNKGKSLLDAYLLDIDMSNLESKLSIASWIIKANKMSNMDVLNRLFSQVGLTTVKDRIKLYDLLEQKGFKEEDLFVHMKGIGTLIVDGNKSQSQFAVKLETLHNAWESLQKITGIKSPTNYSMKEEIDKNAFMASYSVFKTHLEGFAYLRKYEPELLDRYLAFDKVFSRVHELYALESNALKNPNDITEKLVGSKVNSGDIISVVTYLYVKLAHVCKTVYSIKGDAVDMIRELEKRDVITSKEANELHEFRQYRNDIEHANEKTRSMSMQELIRIKEIVFGLGRENK